MCECCERKQDADKVMWLAIARAIGTVTNGLTGVANAIRKRYAEEPKQMRKTA